MGVVLKKGQKVDLTKGDSGIKNIMVGLGWDTNKYDGGNEFDLDASAFICGENGKVLADEYFVFYNNAVDPSKSIVYGGDNRTGEGEGDDETISIALEKVPANVDRISFSVTIHDAQQRSQNFGQVTNSYIRVVNTDNDSELLRFDLGEDFSIETAVVVAEIYRHGGEWKFNAIGSGFQGGLEALCKNFGVNV